LQHYEEDPGLEDSTVTANDMWVHHFDAESKGQSRGWEHPGSP